MLFAEWILDRKIPHRDMARPWRPGRWWISARVSLYTHELEHQANTPSAKVGGMAAMMVTGSDRSDIIDIIDVVCFRPVESPHGAWE
jgi:hypothetical protein